MMVNCLWLTLDRIKELIKYKGFQVAPAELIKYKGFQDIPTRVLAEELRPNQTIISKVITRNPTFLSSNSLAIDALQKMVEDT
ncbi:hypothetical protein L1887_38626 [Cichorium endivia]|nr:hypothetical protein L1887_38626 [Cichorium endivia]